MDEIKPGERCRQSRVSEEFFGLRRESGNPEYSDDDPFWILGEIARSSMINSLLAGLAAWISLLRTT
jgi:hypothetical protein